MKITILGSGAAYGTPNIFNTWGNVKNKQNPKNIRTRASTFIEINNTNFLIDMTPEFREQINNNNISNIDAVFLTHGHYDHIASVPELLISAQVLKKKINVFCVEHTYNEIKTCFPFLFKSPADKSPIIWNVLQENDTFTFNNIEWQTFQVSHDRITTTAFRHKNIAVVMDLQTLSPDNKEKLKNLDLLILECNNGIKVVDNGHNNLPQTLDWVKELKPKKTVLTHISIKVDHEEITNILPQNIKAGYDGMQIELN